MTDAAATHTATVHELQTALDEAYLRALRAEAEVERLSGEVARSQSALNTALTRVRAVCDLFQKGVAA